MSRSRAQRIAKVESIVTDVKRGLGKTCAVVWFQFALKMPKMLPSGMCFFVLYAVYCRNVLVRQKTKGEISALFRGWWWVFIKRGSMVAMPPRGNIISWLVVRDNWLLLHVLFRGIMGLAFTKR